MVKKNKLFGKTLSLLRSLAVVLAICASCITAFAEEAKTFEQTLSVEQTIEGNVILPKYTYRLTPKTDGCPLPEGAKDGVYEFTLDGNDLAKLLLTFPADVAADYKYELTRLEKTPAGDTVKPESHLFGYLVEKNADGSFKITPYTCYDGHMEIWNKTDSDGNPLGITLSNEILGTKGDKGDQGDKGDKGDAGQDGQNGTNGKNGTDGKNGTNGTNGRNGTNGTNGTSTVKTITQTVGKAINTGDPNHILLWGGVIIASAGALVIIAIVRRKKEKDEENS